MCGQQTIQPISCTLTSSDSWALTVIEESAAPGLVTSTVIRSDLADLYWGQALLPSLLECSEFVGTRGIALWICSVTLCGRGIALWTHGVTLRVRGVIA